MLVKFPVTEKASPVRALRLISKPSKVKRKLLQFIVAMQSLYSTMPWQPSTRASRFEVSSIIGSKCGFGRAGTWLFRLYL